MPKIKFEDYLAPWERGEDGKKLEEPAEIDPERLKKYLYGLESDKDELQDRITEVETERDQAKDQLAEVQREHENDEQRRQREEQEREAEIEKLRKSDTERRKLEALEEAFPDATAARLKKLAKRVTGDEKDWVSDAQELVEDGFKITDKPAEQEREVDESGDDLSVRPRVRRSNGSPASDTATSTKGKSVADELDAAGIGRSGW